MAAGDGRNGGLGWFIIGLLIGVAGTLATQKFVQTAGQDTQPAATLAAPQAPPPAPEPAAPPPKPLVHHHEASSASPASASAAAGERAAAEFDDDAAAAGMTSRTRQDPQSAN